jgi:ribosomal protein S18 acetylase RimI-like enzyme
VGSPVQYRRYFESDFEHVMALCANEGWPSYADRVRVHSVFAAPGVVSFVCESGGEVIAFAYFQTDGAIQAHLSLIVVTPKHRRQGMALGLSTFAFDYHGAGRIDLITDVGKGFYRSLPHKEQYGFRIYRSSE